MKYNEIIEKIIEEQNGTILTSDLEKKGIPSIYLTLMVREGDIERVERGVYVSKDKIEDEMFAMQIKYPKIVYSHETALFLHGLSDRTPFEYSVTVPSGYKVTDNLKDKFKIYYVKDKLHKVNTIKIETTFGNNVEIYNIERTIVDIFRSKSRVDIQIFVDALKRVTRINQFDSIKMMEYAKEHKVDKKLREYMEILL